MRVVDVRFCVLLVVLAQVVVVAAVVQVISLDYRIWLPPSGKISERPTALRA